MQNQMVEATPIAPEGFWAVQVLERDHSEGRRYICHARNDRLAVAMATYLSGQTPWSIGFNYYPVGVDPKTPALPRLGKTCPVNDPNMWNRLMSARRSPPAEAPGGSDVDGDRDQRS